LKRSTVKLVATASGLYFALFLIVRSLLPPSVSLPLYFLAAPLIMVVLVLVNDLSARATLPSELKPRGRGQKRLARQVQQLAQQIEVGARSSRSYYETVVIARMRDILVEKVSLETGIDEKEVKSTLANENLGPGLLNNVELYRLLYSGTPSPGPERVRLLEKAVNMIDAWKP
jgi:hypothetical protein